MTQDQIPGLQWPPAPLRAASDGSPSAVVFVGGSGRSGSTLIGRVLGQQPAWVCVGEMVFLWTRGLQDDELCGCGEPFSTCPFWTAVGDRAFGGWDKVDAKAAADLRSTVDRNRYIPLTLGPRSSRYFGRLTEYGTLMSRVYQAVCEVSDARIVVDTSKHPSYAFVLRRVDGVSPRLLHLVRDSRGVSYSWTKQVARPEVTGEQRLMPRYAPLHSATDWLLYNALFEFLGMMRLPRLTVRYEDFIAEPGEVLDKALSRLGQTEPQGDQLLCRNFLGDGAVLLAGDHSLAGNPMRFKEGRVVLRLDDEWRTAMPVAARRCVTALTFVGLIRYGYVAPRRRPPRSRA